MITICTIKRLRNMAAIALLCGINTVSIWASTTYVYVGQDSRSDGHCGGSSAYEGGSSGIARSTFSGNCPKLSEDIKFRCFYNDHQFFNFFKDGNKDVWAKWDSDIVPWENAFAKPDKAKVMSFSRKTEKRGDTYDFIIELYLPGVTSPAKLQIRTKGTVGGSTMEFGVSKPGQALPDQWYNDRNEHKIEIQSDTYVTKRIPLSLLKISYSYGWQLVLDIKQKYTISYKGSGAFAGYDDLLCQIDCRCIDNDSDNRYIELNSAGIFERLSIKNMDRNTINEKINEWAKQNPDKVKKIEAQQGVATQAPQGKS